MKTLFEFLVNTNTKNRKQKLTTLLELIDQNIEYAIFTYRYIHREATIDNAYIVCKGTEEQCNKFADVNHYKSEYAAIGVSATCDDNVVQHIKRKANVDINLDDSNVYICYVYLKNAEEDMDDYKVLKSVKFDDLS